MKFKIDENLPVEAAAILRRAGYDALTVFDQVLSGEGDPEIAAICREEGRIIISLDLGFADIRHYPPQEQAGIVVFRLKRQDKGSVLEILERFVKILPDMSPEHKLWIVEEGRIRVRS
jgi:predicted nuclease of predicted toxin-antitoxin system